MFSLVLFVFYLINFQCFINFKPYSSTNWELKKVCKQREDKKNSYFKRFSKKKKKKKNPQTFQLSS